MKKYDSDASLSPTNLSQFVLDVRGVSLSYQQGAGEFLNVFKDINLTLARGESIALVGPSGSGKSSLLSVCGLIEQPSAGEIILQGHSAVSMDGEARTRLRGDAIGFIYQFHYLITECSVLENVALPFMLKGCDYRQAIHEAAQWLNRLGLEKRLHYKPRQLSGGERQRVAIARALVVKPALILADEPTGNLDPQKAEEVMKLLLLLCKKEGCALLMATHNLKLAPLLDRVLELKEGFLSV